MIDLTELERTGFAALARDIEDARNTRASISSDFAPALSSESRAAVQLGPWDTGYFTFHSGVAVGGSASLTLHQDGAFTYSGHFHVSGAISYNTSFAWAVRTCTVPATVYAFAHTGRVHGTCEAGPRDDDWGKSEIVPALAAGWDMVAGCWSWRWEARVNADFGVFLDDIVKAVAAGEPVAKVVKVFA